MKSNVPVVASPSIARPRGLVVNNVNNRNINPLTPGEFVGMCQKTPFHLNAKAIRPESAEKAAKSKPFGDYANYLRAVDEIDSRNITEAIEQFLHGAYSNLHGAGISFSLLEDQNLEEEQGVIAKLSAKFKSLEMEGQSLSINSAYQQFKGIRQCFRIMQKQNNLKADSILPIEFLPELLMAAPVWFVGAKEKLPDLTKDSDPLPDAACRYFCDQLPNQVGADLYQLYNRRTRPLSQFQGRDIVPAHLLDIIGEARQTFDYLAIMTPYHDQASREWADKQWQRNIDPYLVGFITDLPVMFMLGRWSASGIFPLFLDMVADTVDHIRSHIDLLENFDSAFWFSKKFLNEADRADDDAHVESVTSNNLEASAKTIVQGYEKETLFKILRAPA